MARCESCSIRNSNPMRVLNEGDLINISNKKTVMNFKKGDILFEEGSHLNGVFCLRNGKCKVTP